MTKKPLTLSLWRPGRAALLGNPMLWENFARGRHCPRRGKGACVLQFTQAMRGPWLGKLLRRRIGGIALPKKAASMLGWIKNTPVEERIPFENQATRGRGDSHGMAHRPLQLVGGAGHLGPRGRQRGAIQVASEHGH